MPSLKPPVKRTAFKNKHAQKKEAKKTKFEEETKEREELIDKIEQTIDLDETLQFCDYPISSKTKQALTDLNFSKPTPIQTHGIFKGLKNIDIFGTAKTGSGKTMAFLIPLLENLWRLKWSNFDGLGALVISPTRELAYQTFHVLRDVGKNHNFSAGLLIGGGKDIEGEKKHVKNMCILICTPGRLLQHMNENPDLDVTNLKLLVLDEADKILDMGFQQEMLAILDFLPKTRQTMLYSATRDKKVMDLARACLNKHPAFINAHSDDEFSTPNQLVQSFVVRKVYEKVNFMYQFLKAHANSKIIVFVSCCKQAKYLSECFHKLRVGMPVLTLHGGQKQIRRLESFENFCSKTACALFSTDLASRGLDFPSVDWVVQLDCPSDAITYIHRVGRTARLNQDGKGLLVLMPSELMILKKLKQHKIPICQSFFKTDEYDVTKKLQSFCIRDKEFMLSAQRCVNAYKKTISIQSNKNVFQSLLIDYNKYAISLGLSSIDLCLNFNVSQASASPPPSLLKVSGIGAEKKFDFDDKDDELECSEFLVKSENPTELPVLDADLAQSFAFNNSLKRKTKIGIAKRLLKKGISVNTKIVFDESVDEEHANKDSQGLNLLAANKQLREEDRLDRENERERIRVKHRQKKERSKLQEADEESSFESSLDE